MDMKLEVLVVPVSDVDQAKVSCARLGWRYMVPEQAGRPGQARAVAGS